MDKVLRKEALFIAFIFGNDGKGRGLKKTLN
jgi:hypothetical protein